MNFTDHFAGQGNITSAAEYNWHCDPEAAHAVLAGFNNEITLVPENVCKELSLSWVCNICRVIFSFVLELLLPAVEPCSSQF